MNFFSDHHLLVFKIISPAESLEFGSLRNRRSRAYRKETAMRPKAIGPAIPAPVPALTPVFEGHVWLVAEPAELTVVVRSGLIAVVIVVVV